MAKQPSYHPDEPNVFFADGRASRPLLPGTVARGHLRLDRQLFGSLVTPEMPVSARALALIGASESHVLAALGVTQVLMFGQDASDIDSFPFPITEQVVRHGQNRFMIYCVVCHDPLGTGRGKIVERGYTAPPSYHIERLRKAPVGHLFQVISRGYGSMPAYRKRVSPRDRWAIIAYIRALQLSQHFPKDELSEDMRREWRMARQQVEGREP